MDDTPNFQFNSIEEECSYWREKARLYNKEKHDTQRELDDFTEESRQLEAELEASLTQSERQTRDLKQTLHNITLENESLKKKLQTQENESSTMETKYTQTFKEKEHLKAYIRELEQKNDDLERANRVVSESVAGFETMLNQAYEKNALLENEVDEKEQMQIKLQRLMDEARDLKQELKVRNTSRSSVLYDDISLAATNTVLCNNNQQSETSTTLSLNGDSDLNMSNGSETLGRLRGGSKLSNSTAADTSMTSTVSNHLKQNLNNNQNNNINALNNSTSPIVGNTNGSFHNTSINGAMPTSSRVSALSIVSDLLRKLDLIKKYSIHSRTTVNKSNENLSAFNEQESVKIPGHTNTSNAHQNAELNIVCGESMSHNDDTEKVINGDVDEYGDVALSKQLLLFFRHLIFTTLSVDNDGTTVEAAQEVEEFYNKRKAEELVQKQMDRNLQTESNAPSSS